MSKPVSIAVTYDNEGGKWFTVFDHDGDEHTNWPTHTEAIQAAVALAREQGTYVQRGIAQVSK